MPSPIPSSSSSSGDTSVDRAQQYKGDSTGCNKDCNTCSGCNRTMKDCNCSGTSSGTRENQVANVPQGGGNLGTWSGLNVDELQLEWAGTDPSSKEYTISTLLPSGVKPSELSISVDERTRMLSLESGKSNHVEQKDEDGTMFISQDSAKYTQRSFTLPNDVDLMGIQATKTNQGGVSITLPKTKQQQQLQPQQQLSQGGVKQITIQ